MTLLSTNEAAQHAGLSWAAINKAILRGRLPFQWIGRDRFIELADLEEYLESRPGNWKHYRSQPANSPTPPE